MLFDRSLMWASVSVRHLLESRLHLLAAVEAMSDIEGFHREYLRAVELREGLDELFMAVESKSTALMRRVKDENGAPAPPN
jgi:hypothetical protein